MASGTRGSASCSMILDRYRNKSKIYVQATVQI